MDAIKFNREKARSEPGMAVANAVDDHRVEAARIGSSVSEVILGVRIQAKRHGSRVDYYLDGMRTSLSKVLCTLSTRAVSDNTAQSSI
jgi:hypothetical protein